MNRLQAELRRLYLPRDPQMDCQNPTEPDLVLIDANGSVRALVMEVASQAGWDAVAALWQGIQDDLDLPTPAIAVSGVDSYQVWFSLLEPVPVVKAQNFLESLRLRYLGHIAPQHIAMKPTADASVPLQARHSRLVPAIQAETGHWSAFVAPGLASMFAEEPWLDLPPGPDAQANILSRFECIKPGEFQAAQDRLKPVLVQALIAVPKTTVHRSSMADALPGSEPASTSTYHGTDPKRFLLAVMDDPAVELHLRVEAAKALLPYFEADSVRGRFVKTEAEFK